MGDSLKPIKETIGKNPKQERAKSEDKEKKSINEIISEEKVEKLHEAVESKASVEPTKLIKSEVKVIKRDVENQEKTEEKPEKENTEEEREKRESPRQPVNSAQEKLENKTGAPKDKKRISESLHSYPREMRQKIIRNQSDIFSLKEVPTMHHTTIFSVNGSPSRRVFKKQEPTGHIFQRNDDPPCDKADTPRGTRITKENYNDEKRPSSSYRNPLTGSGLSSNDEYKSKGIKRKDGNPLLGLGYDSEVNEATSNHRIPPGGYSHKLW